ncbi:MAG: hypothetical protein KDE58_40210 [Caldilineaceae bacterium]|nr:hypothetical protein [Caldilineaceae bacterium]
MQRVYPSPPPATGVRLAWTALPEPFRLVVEQKLGCSVVTADSQNSGFSPGVAARLQLADGRRVFLKAVGPTPNPTSPTIHRREAAIIAALPPIVAVPRLLGQYDEGENGWVALWFEEVKGHHPMLPWRSAELDAVVGAVIALGKELTPSPLVPPLVADASTSAIASVVGHVWTTHHPSSLHR